MDKKLLLAQLIWIYGIQKLNNIEFKYLNIGDKFFFEDQEYIKTNFQRGYYYENNRKVFKRFKKLQLILTVCFRWDTDNGQ